MNNLDVCSLAGSRTSQGVVCVIPTHGRDKTLRRSLESVAAQTRLPDAVFIVDDLGSEATKQLANEWCSRFAVHYIDLSAASTKSAGASRNAGAALAPEAVYVAFLDDDDVWLPTYLERSLGRAAESGADLIITWGSMAVGDRLYQHAWRAESGLRSPQILASNPGITGSNMLVRRAAFEAVGGFDSHQWVFNDLDYLVRHLDEGFSYEVVREDLVVQYVGLGEHLSSRSDRRAEGISRYANRLDGRLSRSQRRRLLRLSALARLHARQSRWGKLRYTAEVIRRSTIMDHVKAVRNRLERRAGYK